MELAIYEAFREAGIEEKAAKNIAMTFNTQHATKGDIEYLRLETKADIERLRLETKADIEKIHAEIERLRIETRADIEKVHAEIERVRLETKADIEKAKADIIKWNIGAIIAAAGLAMAIARLFAA